MRISSLPYVAASTRKYGIGYIYAAQSSAQDEQVYGEHAARELRDAAGLSIHGGFDTASAGGVTDRAGRTSVVTAGRGHDGQSHESVILGSGIKVFLAYTDAYYEHRRHRRRIGREAAAIWSWLNLAEGEREACVRALDRYALMFNDTFADTREETIPSCWREHPAQAQELLVQFWAWSAAHLDPTTTRATAVDYHERILPGFQNRLRTRLLGAIASECRKGHHRDVARISQNERERAAPCHELMRLFGHPDPLTLRASASWARAVRAAVGLGDP